MNSPLTSPARPRAEHDSLTNFLKGTLTAEQLRSVGLVSFSQWGFALAALCDVALETHTLGSAVTMALWANRTPLRDTGWTTNQTAARLMGSRTIDSAAKSALLGAGLPSASFADPPIRRWRPSAMPLIPDPVHRPEIRALRYRDAPMGRAILQVHPDLETPYSEEHVWPRRWVRHAARSYAWAFDQTRELITRRGLSALVVYNGRFLHDRAAADAGAALGIPVLFYDSGGADTDYDLTLAETHDWAHLQQRMRRMYDEWPEDERDEVGASWFLDRVSHADPELAVFVDAQERGHRVDVPADRMTVGYFSSSGDEIVELDLEWDRYFGSQENALRELADACRARGDCALIVRTHPHMRIKPKDDLTSWTRAVDEAAPDLHLGPDSPADSYELMRQVDLVVTYGSTVGVEAAFAGKPVIVMGPNAYSDLGCAVPVSTSEQLAACLDSPPVPASASALPYGLMMRRRGFNYTWIEPAEDGVPMLAGTRLDEASHRSQKVSDAVNKTMLKRLNR